VSSELERALQGATPVPAAVTEAARAALGRRAPGELATLTTDDAEGAGATRRRRLMWTTGGVDIHAELVRGPGSERSSTLRGRVVGATVVAASVDVPATTAPCALSGITFEVADVPAGPVRLLVEIADGGESRHLHTDWVTV
jgi:hypothetical protein